MSRHESFHCPVGIVQPVERYRDAVDLSIHTPPFQTVYSCDRNAMRGEQSVHIRDRPSADDGQCISGGGGQAGQQCIQTPTAPNRVRAMGDLDQGAVQVEKNRRLRRPGRSWCACHARTIQRCGAVRKTWAGAALGRSVHGKKIRGFKFVGSTIVYSHMQATGMAKDHAADCFRFRECASLEVAKGEGT